MVLWIQDMQYYEYQKNFYLVDEFTALLSTSKIFSIEKMPLSMTRDSSHVE